MTIKIFKKTAFLLVIMIFGGLGGIIADRYLFPYLSSTKLFSRYDFLKKSTENVVMINKTEQVVVREETSLSKISDPVSPAIVNIVSHDKKDSTKKFKNGTGVILTSDGMIMTHLEALEPTALAKNSYQVFTSDGNNYEAQLVGIDSFSDLAFLKISASNLPIISFEDSNSVYAGEKIIAVGNNSANYSNQYAAGILSRFDPAFNFSGKSLSVSEKFDGAFEYGFSDLDNFVGGPVLNYSGKVIGIVGLTKKEGKEHFFYIPSSKVKSVSEKAIRKEIDTNVVLGVYYVPLTKTYALVNNINLEKGALIYSSSGQQGLAVIAGSPAAKAGLKINDIITAVNGEEITLEKSLSNILYQYKKGDEIELTLVRGGDEMKVKVGL